jgi:hypothetical protein
MEQRAARYDTQGRIFCYRDDSEHRRSVESYISAVFADRFSAQLDQLLPNLIATYDENGMISAAAGYRSAASEKLFLEQYLDLPIEATIRSKYGEAVDRSRIVEVGNLATNGGRAAIALIADLIPELITQGFTWVVFTGNDAVRNLFRRLHLFPFAICQADKAVLGAAGSAWGTYYEHHPIVMAGRLIDGAATISLPPRNW